MLGLIIGLAVGGVGGAAAMYAYYNHTKAGIELAKERLRALGIEV